MTELRKDWSLMKQLIWLRGNPTTGGGGTLLTVSGDTPLALPNALSKPLRKCEMSIDPVQDIHGYSNPWPAGCGVNKLPNAAAQTITNVGLTITTNGDGVYKVTGTPNNGDETISVELTDSYTIPVSIGHSGTGCMYINNNVATSASLTMTLYLYNGDTVVDTWGFSSVNRLISSYSSMENKTINKIGLRVQGNESANVTFALMFSENGYTNNQWEPYFNICPISGWSGATVYRTGTNVLDMSKSQIAAQGTSTAGNVTITYNSDGSLRVQSANSGSMSYNLFKAGTDYELKFPTGTYTFSITGNEGYESYIHIVASGSGYNGAGYFDKADNATVTITDGTKPFSYLILRTFAGGAFDVTINISVTPGSTAATYTPYTGTTVSVEFPDAAGTVYGGTIDPVSGVLTVTHVCKDMGEMDWLYRSSILAFSYSADPEVKASLDYGTVPNIYCSQYKTVSINGMQNSDNCCTVGRQNYYLGSVIVKDTRYSDATAFRTAMSGVQLVYELATPQTSQLTTQQINTIKGTNYVWADCGSTGEVEYKGKV